MSLILKDHQQLVVAGPALLEKEKEVCQGAPSPNDDLTSSSVSYTDHLWSAAAQGEQKQKLHC